MDATYLSGMIPLLVPLLIALGKAAIPTLPKWALPILAPVLGAGAEIAGHYAGLTTGNPVLGAALGALGLWLRELVDQVRKALAGGDATLLRGLLLAVSLALASGCAAQRWDQPDLLTTEQRIEYEAGAGLLTLVRAVNDATGRVDGLAVDGVLTLEEYSAFVALRLRFRAWWQPVYAVYQAGGDVSGEAANFYAWQAAIVDLYLRLARKGGS